VTLVVVVRVVLEVTVVSVVTVVLVRVTLAVVVVLVRVILAVTVAVVEEVALVVVVVWVVLLIVVVQNLASCSQQKCACSSDQGRRLLPQANVEVFVTVVAVAVLVEGVWLLVLDVTVVVEFVTVEVTTVLFVTVSVVAVKVVLLAVVVLPVVVGRPCPAQSAFNDEVPPMRNVWVLFTLGPRTSRLNPNCSTFLNNTVAATLA